MIMKTNTGFFNAVYEAVKLIPRGKVATYGTIARLTGRPKAARYVGYALHVNPQPITIPCHRVVDREGRLAEAFAFGGRDAQRALLESEGIEVKDGKVDLTVCLWDCDFI